MAEAETPALEELAARVASLELALQERAEIVEMRDIELTAMERDLALKARYIAQLELERHLVGVELGQVRQRAAELFADLERDEAIIAELRARLSAIEAAPAYRLGRLAVALARRSGPLAPILRRLADRLRPV